MCGKHFLTSNEDSFRKILDSIKEMQVKYNSTQCWGAKTTRSCEEVNSSRQEIILESIKGITPYFEKAKRDSFALIRQLGPATLFCSFSSAETQWIHLLKILGKLLDNKDYCDSELFNQPVYTAAYPKFSNWQASYYLNQTTVLSLCDPNLPCIYSHKIFLPLIYSTASSQKPTPSRHT